MSCTRYPSPAPLLGRPPDRSSARRKIATSSLLAHSRWLRHRSVCFSCCERSSCTRSTTLPLLIATTNFLRSAPLDYYSSGIPATGVVKARRISKNRGARDPVGSDATDADGRMNRAPRIRTEQPGQLAVNVLAASTESKHQAADATKDDDSGRTTRCRRIS